MNSDTSEMETVVKDVARFLECDYAAAASVCRAAILDDGVLEIRRIADTLETLKTLLLEFTKSNAGRNGEGS